ncbi:hypothetical protein [Pontibacter sp. G13]|uniref:hypothetical protein n=1 Tax=Pontibacter sp. G13 TaxID=3074898 RepID=UPI00288B2740|nr:hypothetical protein [Pontibacter sp. G13]WNJ18398.1 hypothetical protein RJD25_26385 [Pontibacter sp. G13]
MMNCIFLGSDITSHAEVNTLPIAHDEYAPLDDQFGGASCLVGGNPYFRPFRKNDFQLTMSLLRIPILLYTQKFPGKPNDISFGRLAKWKVLDRLHSQAWADFERVALEMPADDFFMVMDGLMHRSEHHSILDDYVKGGSSQDLIRLIRGHLNIHKGWSIRTADWADEVSEDQWKEFYRHLDLAQEDLSGTFEHPTFQQYAFMSLLFIARGKGDKEAGQNLYQSATTQFAESPQIFQAYMNLMTPRWCGSAEEMLEIAKSQSGGLRTLGLLMYLVEMYSEYFYEDYLGAKPKFRAAHQDLFVSWAKDFNIGEDEGFLTIYTRNYLACVYNAFGLKRECDQVLKSLAGNISDWPWIIFGPENARDLKLYRMAGIV